MDGCGWPGVRRGRRFASVIHIDAVATPLQSAKHTNTLSVAHNRWIESLEKIRKIFALNSYGRIAHASMASKCPNGRVRTKLILASIAKPFSGFRVCHILGVVLSIATHNMQFEWKADTKSIILHFINHWLHSHGTHEQRNGNQNGYLPANMLEIYLPERNKIKIKRNASFFCCWSTPKQIRDHVNLVVIAHQTNRFANHWNVVASSVRRRRKRATTIYRPNSMFSELPIRYSHSRPICGNCFSKWLEKVRYRLTSAFAPLFPFRHALKMHCVQLNLNAAF